MSSNWVLRFHSLQTSRALEGFTFPSGAVPSRSYVWWRRAYAISPDLGLLAVRTGESRVQVWNMATGRQVAEWSEGTNHILRILFSPDGRTIVMSSAKNRHRAEDFGPVKLWEFATGHVRSFCADKPETIDPVAFSPDGQFLGVFAGHKQAVASVAFSPDSKTLVTGGNDGTIRFWNIRTRQEVLSFERPGLHPIDLSFSPDGLAFASGSRSFSGSIPQFPLLRAATWAEADAQPDIGLRSVHGE